MTTPEHTLVGIHFAIATGVFHRYGMRSLVLAGLVPNLPDLDGLPMLISMARFEAGHRVWGHNFLFIVLTSLILAALQSRYDIFGALATWLTRRLASAPAAEITARQLSAVPALVLSFCCQALHLPCDMVVSGGHGLSHWLVQPWWPFSNIGYVYPMIPWGDPGPTVILMAGIIVAVRFLGHCRKISILSLATLLLYLTVRRVMSAP